MPEEIYECNTLQPSYSWIFYHLHLKIEANIQSYLPFFIVQFGNYGNYMSLAMNSTLRRDDICAGAQKGPFWRRGWHMQRFILKDFHMLREDG